MPQRVEIWLKIITGLLVIVIGVWALWTQRGLFAAAGWAPRRSPASGPGSLQYQAVAATLAAVTSICTATLTTTTTATGHAHDHEHDHGHDHTHDHDHTPSTRWRRLSQPRLGHEAHPQHGPGQRGSAELVDADLAGHRRRAAARSAGARRCCCARSRTARSCSAWASCWCSASASPPCWSRWASSPPRSAGACSIGWPVPGPRGCRSARSAVIVVVGVVLTVLAFKQMALNAVIGDQ